MELNKILEGNCLDHLRSMPDDFLQCVVTSPPYYGLRSYKTEPVIWDANPDCPHIWGEEMANPKTDTRPIELKVSQGATVGSNVASQHWAQGTMGSYCQNGLICGAWRGELGLEPRFQDYIRHLLQIFAEVKRVLKPDGCVFVNLGDSFNGAKDSNTIHSSTSTLHANSDTYIEDLQSMKIGKRLQSGVRRKSLLNIPHRFFIGMTDELQFIHRNNINWWKRACMPSSAKDRWTVDFESIGFFTKNERYTFNQQLDAYTAPLDRWGGDELVATQSEGWHTGTGQAIYRDRNMRPNPEGRNQRTTWDIPFEPSGNEHYASYPTRLVERMILAGSNEGDIVYDPFGGTATTAVTAHKLGRQWLCSELQPKYVEISNDRLEPYLAQSSLF